MSLLLFKPKITGAKLNEFSYHNDTEDAYFGLTIRIESGGGTINEYDYIHTLFDELNNFDMDSMKEWFNKKLKIVNRKTREKSEPKLTNASFHYLKRGFVFIPYCYYDISIALENVPNNWKYLGVLLKELSNLDMTEICDWFGVNVKGINKKTPMPKHVKMVGE